MASDDDDGSEVVTLAARVRGGAGNRTSERNANGQFVPVQSPTEIALLKHLEALYKGLNTTLDAHTRSTAELLKMQREALQDARAEVRKLHKRLHEIEAEDPEDEETAAARRAGLLKLLQWGPRVAALIEKKLGDDGGPADDA